MTDKEATVFIIDTGASMGKRRYGREETDLDFGLRYVWNKILSIVGTERKTLNIGVVGVRTDETENPLEGEEYSNITIWRGLGQMHLAQVQELKRTIHVSETDRGDIISAVVVAIHMINEFTKKLKYKRKIVLVTDARGPVDAGGYESIAQKLNSDGIELLIVGIDFDDPEYGYKEEAKSKHKAEVEKFLREFTDQCDSAEIGTAAEAIESLSIPTVKVPRPYKTYIGRLTLGNPGTYDTAMSINVERYFRTKVANPPTASTFAVSSSASQSETQSSMTMTANTSDAAALSTIKTAYTYTVNDATTPGGKRDVEREELAKGYMYGSTVVPINTSEENVTKLETLHGFEIVGFIPSESYKPYMNMGTSCITIAQQTDSKSRLALSSLARALYELDSCAIARIVLKEGKDPQIVLLAPLIEPDMEALIDVPLPFAEDIRTYKFPPLDHIVTASGTTLTKHRSLPTDELTEAMSKYIDKMELPDIGTDSAGVQRDYSIPDESYSITLHRLNDAIKQRAIDPESQLEEPSGVLLKFSHPPVELNTANNKELKHLISVADVKKVPPKVRGKRKDAVKPLSNLDIDALLRSKKRTKISAENSVPEFKQLLETTDDPQGIKNAAAQLSNIIRSLITHSLGDSGYGQALENIRVMREELIAYEEPEIYNKFITDLKKSMLDGELGGDRRELWWEVRKATLGLITSDESEVSAVTVDTAKEFYAQRIELPQRPRE